MAVSENLLENNKDAFNKVEVYQSPLSEHIRELRARFLWCILLVIVSFFVIVTFFTDPLMQALAKPIKECGIQFIYLGLSEALTAQLKVSFIAAVIFSMPVIFWHIWNFIKPAFYKNERKAVFLFTLSSVILFLIGVSFGYGVVFLSAITFFVYIGENLATPMLSISQYVDFLFSFVLSFGLVFEMPVIIYVLCRLGIVTVAQLTAIRKYVVLGIFIVAALLTPPDVFSQVLMALPMLLLYEIGIWVVKTSCK
jgi:Twin arginine targeting (Tat) protein translocase TatC